MDRYDVVVGGASLAGCTAAALFARRSLEVLLLERHADPKACKKFCTHFIQASATPTLERAGLARLIAAPRAVGLALWVNARHLLRGGPRAPRTGRRYVAASPAPQH